MKKILFLTTFLLITNSAFAYTLDFSKAGNSSSNDILKNYILEKMPDFEGDVVSYYCDIDKDSKNEILGIAKSNLFYSLAGYKLFALKEDNSAWKVLKNDIYFDLASEFEANNKKIIYHHSVFYKNKKYKAKVKKNKITTTKSFFDLFADKKAHDIEEVTKFTQVNEHNDFQIEQFQAHEQKSVDINYVNLNEKTKHYLELK